MKIQIVMIALSIFCVSSAQEQVFQTIFGPCTEIYVTKAGDTCTTLSLLPSTNFKLLWDLNFQTSLFTSCSSIPTGTKVCLATAYLSQNVVVEKRQAEEKLAF
jgi:hypothetical protein